MKHLKPFNERYDDAPVEPFRKVFDCKEITKATNFVKRIMYLAEQRKHHPAIVVNRFTVTVELITHDENRVTDMDFDMMQDIEKIYSNL